MKRIRYLAFLLALVPTLVLAQDSLIVVIDGAEYGAWEANFGAQFDEDSDIGPLPLIAVVSDGTTAPADQGCDPLVNGDDVKGNIAWIARGSCAFVVKVQNAVAAGAVAVLVHNDDRNEPPEDFSLVFMGGDCTVDGEPPDGGCSIPAAFVSYRSHLAIETPLEFGDEATIECVVCTTPPPPPIPANIIGSTVASTIYSDGFIGNSFGNGLGFTFYGEQGLFIGTVLVGIDGEVMGNPYDGASEFEHGDAIQFTPPFPAPFGSAEAGAQAMFSSDEVAITLSGYAYDAAIVYDMNVANISGGDLDDVYLGLFADFDTGTNATNDDDAGFSKFQNLVYVYDEAEGSAYFGIASLTEDLSGYSTDATTADDAELFEAMTTEIEPEDDPAERAAVIGVGPFDIAAGETKIVRFAMVAGVDELDIIANTQGLICVSCPPSVEGETPEGTYVLESVYPNPLSSETTVGFTLPVAQSVRVAVYVVRLEAGTIQLTQRITVIR